MEERPIIKVSFTISNIIFPVAIASIVYYAAGVRDFHTFERFTSRGGWMILMGIYLYQQFYTAVWILYEDRLIVKRPLRPFYNYFEFILRDIEEIKFVKPNIGKLTPWVVIRCNNKYFKRYDFGFAGNTEKFEELLSILSEKNVTVIRETM